MHTRIGRGVLGFGAVIASLAVGCGGKGGSNDVTPGPNVVAADDWTPAVSAPTVAPLPSSDPFAGLNYSSTSVHDQVTTLEACVNSMTPTWRVVPPTFGGGNGYSEYRCVGPGSSPNCEMQSQDEAMIDMTVWDAEGTASAETVFPGVTLGVYVSPGTGYGVDCAYSLGATGIVSDGFSCSFAEAESAQPADSSGASGVALPAFAPTTIDIGTYGLGVNLDTGPISVNFGALGLVADVDPLPYLGSADQMESLAVSKWATAGAQAVTTIQSGTLQKCDHLGTSSEPGTPAPCGEYRPLTADETTQAVEQVNAFVQSQQQLLRTNGATIYALLSKYFPGPSCWM